MDNVSYASIRELVAKTTAAIATPKQKAAVVDLRSRIAEICSGNDPAVILLSLLMLISEIEKDN